MSKTLGTASVVAETLRHRLEEGLKRISFFIVPSAVAFLALGDVIAAVLYQTGKFTRDDSLYVWTILAGSAVGLLASTMGRLYSSTYYALRDTRTPLKYAVLRVALGGALGYFCSLHLPRLLGVDPRLGAAGITAASGVAGWAEFVLLRMPTHPYRAVGDPATRTNSHAPLTSISRMESLAVGVNDSDSDEFCAVTAVVVSAAVD